MKKQLLFVLLCVVTMVACSQDELSTVTIESRSTLSASVESITDGTRAGMESDGSFFWQEGDKIGVLMTSKRVRPMTLVEGDGGKSSGSFTTTTSETFGKYAIYPYSKDKNSVDANGNLTITFPAEYNYGSVIGEKENSFGFAMWGQIVNDSVAFKHLGGVFKIYVHNLPVGDGMQFTFSTTGKKLTGEFTTTLTSTEPMLETSNDDVNDTVTITFNNSVENGTAVFYIPTPVGTYPEIDVVITDAEGEEIAFGFWENQTVKRRAQKKGEIGEKTITGGEEGSTTIPATGGELVGEHTLTADITLEQPFTVPAGKEAIVNLNGHNITNTSDSDIKYFDIFYVEEGATLTINGEGNVEAVDGIEGYCVFAEGNVIINGGSYKSGKDAAGDTNACIYADNGNITIYGGEFTSEGNFTINKDGDSIENTIIEVKGGKFNNFDPANNEADGTGTNYVAEGYISVETSENVWEVFPATEPVEVATAAALEDVLAQGGKATLTADIAIEKSLIVADGKSATLDLNGNDITVNTESVELGEGDAIIVYGDLTINGEGTVKGNTRAVWARSDTGATVTINGGTYVGSTKEACEVIYASGNGQIVINGGDFSATNINEGDFAAPQYAVLNLHGNGKDGANITVYGGTFHNFDPANNISENPVQSFVAEGYASVKTSDEVYEVVPLDEAYNMPNAVITLAAGTYTLPTEFAEGVTLNCQEGVIFEGQSSLDINGAKIVGAKFANTDEKGKVATGVINGEFVDCVFEGEYALRNMKLGAKASFDGCEFIGLVYGVHFDGVTTTNTELVFNDCDFTGWNSFGTAITKVTMTGCRFHHSGKGGYGRLRFYQNAVVSSSTFDETYDGIDFGNLGNGQGGLESTFTDCTWTNKNIVDLFVFTGLDTVIIDGETYPVVATTADAVVEALANGDVVANATISVASELDGQGNTLFVDNELTSNHIVTASNDATIKNLNIEGGNIRTTNNKATYALYFTGGNIVVDNVSVDEVAYTINYQRTSTTASEFTLTVSNSTLTGWTSWGTIDWAKFNNVHFGIGTYYEKGSLFCGGMRPYAPTTLENCTFDKNFYISTTELSESVTITMKNCKVDGVVLTKDNWQSYLKVEGENTAFVLFE